MDASTLDKIAELICGNGTNHPEYRSSLQLTAFFERAGMPHFVHDGSTRQWWVLEKLKECSREQLAEVLKRIVSPREYGGDRDKIRSALSCINEIVYVEGFKIILDGMTPKFVRTNVDFSFGEKTHTELTPLEAPDFLALGLELGIGEILQNRWEEAQRCVDAGAHLSAIIIMGSLLEGLLLGVCRKNLRQDHYKLNFLAK